MADDSLKDPVSITSYRIDSTLLPSNFSIPYQLYVVQQSTDLGNVAGKANDAAGGAYDAQVKNDEQDVTLADHELRIRRNEAEIADHEQRITAAESTLVNHEQRINGVEQSVTLLNSRVEAVESDVSNIKGDYLSKSETDTQVLASPIDVATSYSVNGTKVVGARVTGFTAATGTANKGSFNANQSFTISATYTQSEIQAIANALVATRQRCKALEDALRSHGLIN